MAVRSQPSCKVLVLRRGACRTAGTATAKELWLEALGRTTVAPVACLLGPHPFGAQGPGQGSGPYAELQRGRFPSGQSPGGAGGGPDREGLEQEPIRTGLCRGGACGRACGGGPEPTQSGSEATGRFCAEDERLGAQPRRRRRGREQVGAGPPGRGVRQGLQTLAAEGVVRRVSGAGPRSFGRRRAAARERAGGGVGAGHALSAPPRPGGTPERAARRPADAARWEPARRPRRLWRSLAEGLLAAPLGARGPSSRWRSGTLDSPGVEAGSAPHPGRNAGLSPGLATALERRQAETTDFTFLLFCALILNRI